MLFLWHLAFSHSPRWIPPNVKHLNSAPSEAGRLFLIQSAVPPRWPPPPTPNPLTLTPPSALAMLHSANELLLTHHGQRWVINLTLQDGDTWLRRPNGHLALRRCSLPRWRTVNGGPVNAGVFNKNDKEWFKVSMYQPTLVWVGLRGEIKKTKKQMQFSFKMNEGFT